MDQEEQVTAKGSFLNKFNKKNKIIGIIALSVALVIIIIGAISFFTRGEEPEVVTEKYINAHISHDYDTLSEYSALNVEQTMKLVLTNFPKTQDEVRSKLLEEYEMTDVKKIYEGPLKNELNEDFKNEYGADYIVSVDITSTEELTESEMNYKISMYEENYDSLKEQYNDTVITEDGIDINNLVDLSKINAMCRVRGRLSVSGSDDSDYDTFEMYCVKMGGKWKVLDDFYAIV